MISAYANDNSEETKAKVQQLKISLEEAKDNLKETILGPSLANIFKINNKYRFQILIKYM